MLKQIKHIILPTKLNKYHPHILHKTGLSVIVALLLAMQLLYNYVTTKEIKVLSYATDINIAELYNLTNNERLNAGIDGLSLNEKLNAAAVSKAADMLANNYWAHVSPSGLEPWYFINQANYPYSYAGENLAKNFDTSTGVVAGWMASGSHRQNMLNPNYRDVGFAVVNGTLQGEQTTLVVAMYGAPQTQLVAVPPAPTQAAPANNPVQTELTPQAEPSEPAAVELKAGGEQVKLAFSGTEQILASGSLNSVKQFNPLKLQFKMGWGKYSSIWLLGLVMFSSLARHGMIRHYRKIKKQYKRVGLHPLIPAGVTAIFIVILIISSFGIIH